jgi:hypothetical protein
MTDEGHDEGYRAALAYFRAVEYTPMDESTTSWPAIWSRSSARKNSWPALPWSRRSSAMRYERMPNASAATAVRTPGSTGPSTPMPLDGHDG